MTKNSLEKIKGEHINKAECRRKTNDRKQMRKTNQEKRLRRNKGG